MSILHEDTLVHADFELLSIDITREYNKIPTAELVYIDGNPSTKEFAITDSSLFETGSKVEIRLKYEGRATEEKTVFKGLVISKGLQMSGTGGLLRIELIDPSVKMTAARKSFIHRKLKDSDVIGNLISENKLTAGTVTATNVLHNELVQYAATDWDFMICRAEANGLLVSVTDGTITAVKPDVSVGEKRTFTFGLDEIYSFEFEADSRHQHTSVESRSWDQKTQDLAPAAPADAFVLNQTRLNGTSVNTTMGNAAETLVSGVTFVNNEAKAWADAKQQKDRMSMLRGRIRISGDAGIAVGNVVRLVGLSKLFSGNTIVTGIRHQVSNGGWQTDLQFGLSADWFASRPLVTEPQAAGLLPGINGLQIAVVEAFEADPEKEFRIKVKVPSIISEKNTLMARLSMPDAGEKHGVFFLPEVGDEVILGFLNDDPRQPIILGSVFSSKRPLPVEPDAKNAQKGILTKSGLKLSFDDEQQTITLATSEKNSVVINEKEKFIELKDANNNSVKLNADGITFTSGKDLILNATGDVKIAAKGNVKIEGTAVDVI